MFKIRIDGKDFQDETEAGLQAKVDAHYTAKTLEATNAAAATEKARADALEKANAKLAEDLASEKKRADEAPAKLAARVGLEAEATKLIGNTAKFDGKTDREIRIETIKKFDSSFVDTGMSDDAVTATYGVWAKVGAQLSSGPRADASTRKIATVLGGAKPEGERTDEEDPSNSDAARARRTQRTDSGAGAFTFTRDAAVKGQANG